MYNNQKDNLDPIRVSLFTVGGWCRMNDYSDERGDKEREREIEEDEAHRKFTILLVVVE